jgi:CIC family chloride channel protein
MRSLTVGSMMRKDVQTIAATATLADFRRQAPLGSSQRVVAIDSEGRYAGVLIVAEIYSEQTNPDSTVLTLAKFRDSVLVPSMNVQSAAETFQRAGAEELAVVKDFTDREVVGLLTESHLMRRYADELDKARRDLAGEG